MHFCSDDSHSYHLQTAVHRLALTVGLLPVEVYGLSLLVCQAFAHHHLVWESQLVLLETEYTSTINAVSYLLLMFLRYGRASSMVMPSIPGAPLFALTLLYALLKLSLYSIVSKSLGCALSLSFHIRLNDLDAFTYPSCSALSLCEQPLFQCFCHRRSFLLSRSYSRLLLIRSFTSRLL